MPGALSGLGPDQVAEGHFPGSGGRLAPAAGPLRDFRASDMNFGFWNFYTFYNNNRMFTEAKSLVGDDLAYPTVLLGQHLRAAGHEAATLDTKPLSWFDRIFFLDYLTKLNPHFRQLQGMRHPDVNLIAC